MKMLRASSVPFKPYKQFSEYRMDAVCPVFLSPAGRILTVGKGLEAGRDEGRQPINKILK